MTSGGVTRFAAAVLAVAGGVFLAVGCATLLRPYSVAGSAHTGSAVREVGRFCADDEGEAVASGVSTPAGRGRCLHALRVRLSTGAVLLVAGVAAVTEALYARRRAVLSLRAQPASYRS